VKRFQIKDYDRTVRIFITVMLQFIQLNLPEKVTAIFTI